MHFSASEGLRGVGGAALFLVVNSLDTLRASGAWWLSALLYTALQVTGLFSFLPSVGASIAHRKEAVLAGIVARRCFSLSCLPLSRPPFLGWMRTTSYTAWRSARLGAELRPPASRRQLHIRRWKKPAVPGVRPPAARARDSGTASDRPVSRPGSRCNPSGPSGS